MQNLPSIYQIGSNFVKQVFRIQIQKGRKVLLWNLVKYIMEVCYYSELILIYFQIGKLGKNTLCNIFHFKYTPVIQIRIPLLTYTVPNHTQPIVQPAQNICDMVKNPFCSPCQGVHSKQSNFSILFNSDS